MKKGFTLIELLVVIAIVSLLSSVVLSSLNSAREKSRAVQRYSDLHSVQGALELYRNDNGAYPIQTSWTSQCTSWSGVAANLVIPGLVPTYLPSMPADPSMTNPNLNCYIYRSTATGSDYKFLDYNVIAMANPPLALVDPARNELDPWDNGAACPSSTSRVNTLAIWSGPAIQCL